MDGITLQAVLAKITSTQDGGWKLTFDVPNSETDAVMKLSPLRQDVILQLAAIPIEDGNV